MALAVIVVLHLGLVVPLAATLNIWIDESYTLQSTGSGAAHAIRRALSFELQPPLYFVVLAIWRTLNDTLFFARLFSIICTALTVVLAPGLARRYAPGFPPALFAAVIGFSPLTVYAAVEARFYAFTLLLAALLLLFFYDGHVTTHGSTVARRRYMGIAIAGLYTHYFLGFYLAAGAAVLICLRRGAALRRYILDMIIVATFFAPLAATTARQVQSVSTSPLHHLTPTEAIQVVWARAWRFILPAISRTNNPLEIAAMWVSRLAAPLALLMALFRRRLPGTAVIVTTAFATVVSVFFLAVALRLGPEFSRPWHTTALYLPVMLAAFAILEYLGGPRTAALGAVASLAFALPTIIETYAPLSKYGDWIRVAHYVERNETKNQPILVFKAEFGAPLAYHYSGINRIVSLPAPCCTERFQVTTMVLHNEIEITEALAGRLGPERQFWLVTSFTGPWRDIDFHPEILENFIAGHCTVQQDVTFNETRVRLITVKPSSADINRGAAPRPGDRVHMILRPIAPATAALSPPSTPTAKTQCREFEPFDQVRRLPVLRSS